MIASKDGKTLIAWAPASETTQFSGFTAMRPYAAYKCANLTSAALDNCTEWGDYSLYGTNIVEMAVRGNVGRYVLADNTALKTLTVSGSEIPFGIAKGCTALATVNFTDKVTIVKQDAFAGCTSLKEIDLGTILAILEADCFKGSAIEKSPCRLPTPPVWPKACSKKETISLLSCPTNSWRLTKTPPDGNSSPS